MIKNPPQWLKELMAKGAENFTPADHVRFEIYLKSVMKSDLWKKRILAERITALEEIAKEMKC